MFLARKGYGDDEIAFVIHRSSALVGAYRQLLTRFEGQRSARARLQQICDRVQPAKPAEKPGKKGGRQP